MINKKNIISTVVLVGAIAISGVATYGVKSNADEETLSQVKMDLQKQINDKTEELEKKDKQIEELNSKVSGQEETINQLNNNITQLTSAVNNTQEAVENTQQDLSSAKATQKADKQEVVNHTDEGDSNLQQQIDTINSNCEENQEVPKSSVGSDAGCYSDNKSGTGSGTGTR